MSPQLANPCKAQRPLPCVWYRNCWLMFSSWFRGRGLEPDSCLCKIYCGTCSISLKPTEATLMEGQLVSTTIWFSFCMVPGSYAPFTKGCSSVGHAIGPAGIEQVTLLSNGRDKPEYTISMTTSVFLALATAKCVSELSALYISPTCLSLMLTRKQTYHPPPFRPI